MLYPSFLMQCSVYYNDIQFYAITHFTNIDQFLNKTQFYNYIQLFAILNDTSKLSYSILSAHFFEINKRFTNIDQ